MANRTRIDNPGKTGQQTVIKDPARLSSSLKSQPKDRSDDVIVSLTDAYENKRARQVSEWERLYGHNVYRAT